MGNSKMLNAAVLSNVGLLRRNNEDNYILGHCLNDESQDESKSFMCRMEKEWICCGVFDGMGGIDAGEAASLAAAESFQAAFLNDVNGYDYEKINEIVENTFSIANSAVWKLGENKSGCGTTGTVIVTDGDRFKIYHVGDSRAYLWRGGELFLLTKDQTVAQMKMDIGVYGDLNQAQEKEHHQLVEFIGYEDDGNMLIPLESKWNELLEGDKILVCSDGLYDMCSDTVIYETFKKGLQAEELTEEFVKCALEHGGKDNVTALVLERG